MVCFISRFLESTLHNQFYCSLSLVITIVVVFLCFRPMVIGSVMSLGLIKASTKGANAIKHREMKLT